MKQVFVNYLKIEYNVKYQMRGQSGSNSRRSSNTFNKRPVVTQIVAYIVVVSQIIIYPLCIQSKLPKPIPNIIISILFYTSFLALCITGFITSYVDTRDAKICISSNIGQKGLQKMYQLYCAYCRITVANNSRHCKLCNACTEQFDHHCVWINNCIGKYNYTPFICMLILVCLNFLTFVISVILVWQQMEWNQYLVEMIINWVSFAVILVFLILVCLLTAFHFYLIYHGKTTYEYLTSSKSRIIPEIKKKTQFSEEIKSQVYFKQGANKEDNEIRHRIGMQTFQTTKIQVNKDNTQKGSQFNQVEREQSKNVIIFERNSQSSNYTEEVLMYRKNKSYDFIFGKIDIYPRANISRQVSDAQKQLQVVGNNIQDNYQSLNIDKLNGRMPHRK